MTDLRQLEQQQARALAATRKKRRKLAPKRVDHKGVMPVAKGQRQPRERDAGYLAWLHEGLPCVACVIEYAPTAVIAPLEAAHQKFNLNRPGWVKFTGKRVHDRQALPLCPWHHQHAPNACDKAQAKFWPALGLELERVADLCRDLYAAFKGGSDGAAVIRRYAAEATTSEPAVTPPSAQAEPPKTLEKPTP